MLTCKPSHILYPTSCQRAPHVLLPCIAPSLPFTSASQRLPTRHSQSQHHPRSATRRDLLLATAAMSTMQPTTTTSGKLDTHDLLVVGPGVLGSYLASQWLNQHPGASAVAQTNTTNNHARCECVILLVKINGIYMLPLHDSAALLSSGCSPAPRGRRLTSSTPLFCLRLPLLAARTTWPRYEKAMARDRMDVLASSIL